MDHGEVQHSFDEVESWNWAADDAHPGVIVADVPAVPAGQARDALRALSDGAILEQARELLRKHFGYTSFREPQDKVLLQVIRGGDGVVILPTGGGKSLCYQLPALMLPGTGIVISPLIALMDDQVAALRAAGINAAAIHSGLDAFESARLERDLLSGKLDLAYVSPERIMSARFRTVLARCSIALIAIDEAHCLSQWGHDFRPEYVQLGELASAFPGVPRLALTATADPPTRAEIISRLGLSDAASFIMSMDRPNLRFTVAPRADAHVQLLAFLAENHPADSGIVYRSTRSDVERTTEMLVKKGFNAMAYHAGMDASIRRTNQKRFLQEDRSIMVATVAFGMGIDKPDVRFVAHLDLPRSVESWVQESGRAGRDGLPADAWMVWGLSDLVLIRRRIDESPSAEERKRVEARKLDMLLAFCESSTCRRATLLEYFGELAENAVGECNCDNCRSPAETWDATTPARKALSAMMRTGQRFGSGYLIDILRGKVNERASANGHISIPTFGVGADMDEATWKSVFRQLLAAGMISLDIAGHGALTISNAGKELLKGEGSLLLRRDRPVPKKTKASKLAAARYRSAHEKPGDSAIPPAVSIAELEPELWERLRSIRTELAREHSVPAYVVAADRSLADMAAKRPQTLLELQEVFGFGETKAARYGAAFLVAFNS